MGGPLLSVWPPQTPTSGSGVHLNQIDIKLSKREVDITWRMFDCEELVGGLVTRNNGVKFIVGIAAYSIADCIS